MPQFLKTYRKDNTIYEDIKRNGRSNRPKRSNSDDNLGVESKNPAQKALGLAGCLLNNSGDGLSDDSDDKDSFDFEIHEM